MLKQIKDMQVQYNVSGRGYPLVLLHGGGSDSETWEEVVPYLSKDFQVYWMDLRGFGKTVRPPEPRLSVEVWTSDVLDFMDAMTIPRAAIVGWSLGAVIGTNFTALHPDRVSHLVLIGAPGLKVVTDRSGFEERMRLARSGAPMEEVIEKTFAFTKSSMSPHTIANNPRAVEKAKQALMRNSPSNYAEMVEAIGRMDLGPKLSQIRCPTLILVGDADSRTPIAASEELNKAIAPSYMKIIPNCGHQYGYEQPATTSQATIEFLTAFNAR